MNLKFKFVLVLALTAVLAAAATPKKGKPALKKTPESEMLYKKALAALENGQFRIDMEEIYFEEGDPVKQEQGCFVWMSGNQATIHFAMEIFPNPEFDRCWHHEYDEAKIEMTAKKRNGNVVFVMEAITRNVAPIMKLTIILYKNTDRCFVEMSSIPYGSKFAKFKGKVIPL